MLVDRETLQKNFASMSDAELLERHARGELTDLAFDVIEGELRSRGAQFATRPNPKPDSSRADDQSEANAPLLKSGNGDNINVLLDVDAPDDIDSPGGPTVGESGGQIKEPAKSPMRAILTSLMWVLVINVPSVIIIISLETGAYDPASFAALFAAFGVIVILGIASVLVLFVGVVAAITRAERRSVLDDDAPNDIKSHGSPTVSEDGKPSDATSKRIVERAPRFSVGRTILVTLLVVTWLISVAEVGFGYTGSTLLIACFTLFPGIMLVIGGLSKRKKVRLASTRATMIIPGLAFLFILVVLIAPPSRPGNDEVQVPCILRAVFGYLHCD